VSLKTLDKGSIEDADKDYYPADSNELLEQILIQLKILNAYMAEGFDTELTEEDLT